MSLYSKAKRVEQRAVISPRLPIVAEKVAEGEYINRTTGERIEDIEALEKEYDVIVMVWA